ncbi:hypothetical protein ARMGADRAFT_1035846 [Armillaria gallica]|uniref:Uncharacterized protein n=1 Tax=Armillaria gallica TaxID=47427 RepID=A0A2H3CSS8_ARMGA|nr:hypothetical protein ARMGADRAFT_1035846 [Armillaria gallica]
MTSALSRPFHPSGQENCPNVEELQEEKRSQRIHYASTRTRTVVTADFTVCITKLWLFVRCSRMKGEVPRQNGFATLENLGIIKVVLATTDRGHEIETEVSRIMTLDNLDRPKPRPNGDPPKVFIIIEGGPVIEHVHAYLANMDFRSRIRRTGKTAAMSVSQPSRSSECETMARSCGWIHTAVASLPRMTSGHRRAPRRDDTLPVRVGKRRRGFRCRGGAVNPAVGVCSYTCGAGPGGVEDDLACTDDEDGRRTEDDLEGMVTSILEAPSSSVMRVRPLGEVVAEGHGVTRNVDRAELSYMKATGTHNDTATPTSDSGFAFIFTSVNVAPSEDHSEHLCPRPMSHIARTDKILWIGLAVIGILVLESLRANGTRVDRAAKIPEAWKKEKGWQGYDSKHSNDDKKQNTQLGGQLFVDGQIESKSEMPILGETKSFDISLLGNSPDFD